MRLYIGNCTGQRVVFHYRTAPGTPTTKSQLRTQVIETRTQIALAGDLTKEEIDYIVAQQGKYGLIWEDAISQTAGFHGLCFQTDKPISSQALTYVMQQNMGVLVERGHDIRLANGVAQSSLLQNALTESGRPERVAALDMTYQQTAADPNNPEPQMSEGVYVQTKPDGGPGLRPGRPPRGG